MDDIPQKQPRLPLEIKLILADTNPGALDAWRSQYGPKYTEPREIEPDAENGSGPQGPVIQEPRVEIRDGDFLDVDADAIIVPGNSFGFLDGGLELRVCERHGLELQDRLRDRIRTDFAAELLVGQAVIEDLGPSHPVVIYAPIWRTPQDIGSTVNVFLASKGAFQALSDAERPDLKRIAAPPMGIDAPGRMHPHVSARQFRYGYEIAIKKRGRGGKNLTQLVRRERKMKSVPSVAAQEAVPEE